MIPLLYLVPGLLAAGAAAWEWVRTENDPQWADKTVFNDRMRQLHSHILNLNTVFAACKTFMASKAQLTAWRAFKTNWSKFYAEVGQKTYFDPNASQIANAKLYTSQLAQWVDTLNSLPECKGQQTPSPATVPSPTPLDDARIDGTLRALGWLGAGWLVLRFLKRRRA